ncbi:SAM-dependent methyltransferase [Hyalangium rubrum]|uniref:Class I SAM-dependent methyltransferase n=1 Tax=Hyalangium rubrum TaxID=3103134 RepID=A0ABU5HFE5_9BACT|nr:class I SAM-dependent methyltransferase [Hyalangium sp. s54d21]MDY7230785.1 class I SAM-dependent methyltransferase [Hyalangium sp. s54d21]
MSSAGPFPLYYPGDARRAFGSDEATRRFARVAQLEPGSRVLVLGCGPNNAAVLLARDMGCSVVAADTEDALLAQVRERVRALGLGDRVETRRVDLERLGLPESEFDAILIQGRVFYPLTATLGALRRLLAKRGRIGMTYPARVGRYTAKAALEFWEKRLGAPPLLPRELLLELEAQGYEPESAESLTDLELDNLYREIEGRLDAAPPEQAKVVREEIAIHREQNGKAGVSYAFIIGRRKEPGEKPPASRDRG